MWLCTWPVDVLVTSGHLTCGSVGVRRAWVVSWHYALEFFSGHYVSDPPILIPGDVRNGSLDLLKILQTPSCIVHIFLVP